MHLHEKRREVCVKTKAIFSLACIHGQVAKHKTVTWNIPALWQSRQLRLHILKNIKNCSKLFVLVCKSKNGEPKRLQHHATLRNFDEKFGQFQIDDNDTQHLATHRNSVAKRAQRRTKQCCDMLR